MTKEPQIGDLIYFITDSWGSKDKMFEERDMTYEKLILVLKVTASSKESPQGLIIAIEPGKDVEWCHIYVLKQQEMWWFAKGHLGVSSEARVSEPNINDSPP